MLTTQFMNGRFMWNTSSFITIQLLCYFLFFLVFVFDFNFDIWLLGWRLLVWLCRYFSSASAIVSYYFSTKFDTRKYRIFTGHLLSFVTWICVCVCFRALAQIAIVWRTLTFLLHNFDRFLVSHFQLIWIANVCCNCVILFFASRKRDKQTCWQQ